MAGWESGPGKASTALVNNYVNFQKRNFSSPHLQTSAESRSAPSGRPSFRVPGQGN